MSSTATIGHLFNAVCADVGREAAVPAVAPVDEQPTVLPAPSRHASVAAMVTRTVVPRKVIGPRQSLRQLRADRITRRWMPCPAVSTEEVYEMLLDMPAYSPFAIVAAAQRCLQLTDRQLAGLRRRLSAVALGERRMVAEVRWLLPVGELDGNSAIVAVKRVEAWLQCHN